MIQKNPQVMATGMVTMAGLPHIQVKNCHDTHLAPSISGARYHRVEIYSSGLGGWTIPNFRHFRPGRRKMGIPQTGKNIVRNWWSTAVSSGFAMVCPIVEKPIEKKKQSLGRSGEVAMSQTQSRWPIFSWSDLWPTVVGGPENIPATGHRTLQASTRCWEWLGYPDILQLYLPSWLLDITCSVYTWHFEMILYIDTTYVSSASCASSQKRMWT